MSIFPLIVCSFNLVHSVILSFLRLPVRSTSVVLFCDSAFPLVFGLFVCFSLASVTHMSRLLQSCFCVASVLLQSCHVCFSHVTFAFSIFSPRHSNKLVHFFYSLFKKMFYFKFLSAFQSPEMLPLVWPRSSSATGAVSIQQVCPSPLSVSNSASTLALRNLVAAHLLVVLCWSRVRAEWWFRSD